MSPRQRDDAEHRQSEDARAETDGGAATMKDVSHTPPAGESVTNVWRRGDETARNRGDGAAD